MNKETEIDKLDELERVERGAFGQCSTCGNEIEGKRLKAVPYAINGIDCENAESYAEFEL